MKKQTLQNLVTTALTCCAFALTGSARAADIVKADNADNLNLTTSWTNGVVPTAADVAVWDGTVTSANTTLLGANTRWAGIRIASPGGLVTIGAGSTLTNGAAGIDMSLATADLTLQNGVVLLANNVQSWKVGAGRLLTLSGALTRAATGSSAVLNFDTSLGGIINIDSGTASTLLLGGNAPYATLNLSGYAALDASKNVVEATAFYGDYNLGGTLSGTYGSPILNITGTTAGATQAWRQGNTFTVPNGVRFGVANTENTKWTVDTSSSGRLLTTGAILIGPGVGAQDVEFNGSGGVRQLTSGQDLILHQNNPLGNLIFNTTINPGSSSSATVLLKSGGGRVILNAANSYTGPTRVEQGTLLVNGSTTAASAVSVNNGATVGGSGTINGSLTVLTGGIIASGNQIGAGALTVGGGITVSSGASRMRFYGPTIPVTNTTALLLANGVGLVNNGTVSVDILSGTLTVGQYPLIRSTNGIAGAGTFSLGSIKPHVDAYLSNNVANNSIDLVVTAVNQPLKWTKSSAVWDINTSTNWQDSPAAATTYQEVGPLGDSVLFEDTVSGAGPITVTLNTAVVPSSVQVNNPAKSYTITGSGSIGGAGSLTKSGAASLTLGTVNTFTGGVNLNGGVTTFSQIDNLGAASSAITFGGGTLRFASGNAADLSQRTVTLAAGGGTLDVLDNYVSFFRPIGNNGVGGLTKAGSGTLAIYGTNLYSGPTIVTGGTLQLSPDGTPTRLPNSPFIQLNAGTTLDTVNNSGYTLSASASQKLTGTGAVNGGLTVPAGTTVTPATNGVVGTLSITNDLTVSGGTLALDVSTTARDLILVQGNLNLNSGLVEVIASGTLTNGLYLIIQYSGTLGGSVANLLLSGFSQAGKTATLDESVAGQISLRIATAGGASIVWQGDGSANLWDVEASLNWLNGVTPSQFVNGDFVTFNDSGSANGTVSLASAVLPGGVTVNSSADYTFTTATAGRLSGTTGLTKSGAGRLIIETDNNNSGGTLISSGTLEMRGNFGTGPVTNNASLVFNKSASITVAGAVSGTGSVEVIGTPSTVQLAGGATFTGPTTIANGMTLHVGNGGAAGTIASSAITNDGTLVLDSSTSWTLPLAIQGAGGLSKAGSGTLTLGFAQTYNGNTSVSNGGLRLSASEQIPHGPPSTGWLILDGGAAAAGLFDLNGFNETVNALSGLGNTVLGRIANNGAPSGQTNTLNVSNNVATTYAGLLLDNTGTGGILRLVKQGPGSLRLNGVSTFSGGTVVDEGTLTFGPGADIGTGGILLKEGTTFNMVNNGSTSSFPGDELTVAADATATLSSSQLGNGFGGTMVSGNSASTNVILGPVSFGSQNVKQLQPFTGTVRIPSGAQLRFSSTSLTVNGGDNTTFEVNGQLNTRNGTATGAGVSLGALTGSGSLDGAGNADGNGVYVIGAKGISTTFTGNITGTAPRGTSIVKTGAGSLTLDGTLSYDGSTTVNNGALIIASVSNPNTSLDTSASITVTSNAVLDVSARTDGTLNLGLSIAQTLSGYGTIRGSLNEAANSTVNVRLGTLMVTNAASLSGALNMQLNRTNGIVTNSTLAAASVALSGTLTVTNLGPVLHTGDKFKLFSVPVSGTFTLSLPVSGLDPSNNVVNYTWTDKLAIDGSIEVASGYVPPAPSVNPNPTNIVATFTSTDVTLAWPESHMGWTLQVQTNNRSVGLTVATNTWFDVPASAGTNSMTFPVNKTDPTVFYRLRLPQP